VERGASPAVSRASRGAFFRRLFGGGRQKRRARRSSFPAIYCAAVS
jgi:hypothetical protein